RQLRNSATPRRRGLVFQLGSSVFLTWGFWALEIGSSLGVGNWGVEELASYPSHSLMIVSRRSNPNARSLTTTIGGPWRRLYTERRMRRKKSETIARKASGVYLSYGVPPPSSGLKAAGSHARWSDRATADPGRAPPA